MKDNTQEMLRRARELTGSGQVFQPMGMEAAKAKLEQHLNGGISNARDRLRESAQCEQTVVALNDLLNETQKKAMMLVQDNDRLRAELAELRKQPAAVPEAVAKDAARIHAIGLAINRAAGELPAGYEIRIDIERDAGTVELYSPDDDVIDHEWDGETFAGEIESAIDAAILSAADTEVKK